MEEHQLADMNNDLEIVNKVMDQFWTTGYEATSLDALMSATSLSRSDFYQMFGGKQPALELALEQYRFMLVGQMEALLSEAESGLQFIRLILMGVALGVEQPAGRRGCLALNCATEIAQREPDIANVVGVCLDSVRDAFKVAIERAQREGDIDPERDADGLAAYVLACKGGLETFAKAGWAREEMEAVVETMMAGVRK